MEQQPPREVPPQWNCLRARDRSHVKSRVRGAGSQKGMEVKDTWRKLLYFDPAPECRLMSATATAIPPLLSNRLSHLHAASKLLDDQSPSTSAYCGSELRRLTAPFLTDTPPTHSSRQKSRNVRIFQEKLKDHCAACGSLQLSDFIVDFQSSKPLKRKRKSKRRKPEWDQRKKRDPEVKESPTDSPEPDEGKRASMRRKTSMIKCARCANETRYESHPVLKPSSEPLKPQKQTPQKRHLSASTAPAARGSIVGGVHGPATSSEVGQATLRDNASANAASKKRAKTRKGGRLQAMVDAAKARESNGLSPGGAAGAFDDLLDFMKTG